MAECETVMHNLVVEEGFGKRCGVERLEVRELFADPDEFNRNVQFIDDADDDASLGGTIELGHDEPRQSECLMKLLCLRHTVLADGGIEDEQDLMRSPFVLAGEHSFDLFALFHEIHFGVEAARS